MNDNPVKKNKGRIVTQFMDEDPEIIPLITDEEIEFDDDIELPDNLPILPLRNTVLFPGVVIPITVGRKKSLRLIREAYQNKMFIGVITQKDVNNEDPGIGDLFGVGTVAQVVKILEMPDNSTSVVIQGKKRFQVNELVTTKPYLKATIIELVDIPPKKPSREFDALVGSLKDLSMRIINASPNIAKEAAFAIRNIESPSFLINFIASNTDVKADEKQKLLETAKLEDRGTLLLQFLSRELQMLELKNDIQSKVKLDMDQQQREYLLHQQMKTIQDELGGNPVEQEIKDLKELAKKKKWSKEVGELFLKEVDKLGRLNAVTGEYSVQLNYVQTLLELPWNEYTKDNFDLKRAQRILDRDHYGLEKVKDRIIEHLAVLKLKGDLKSPILCLYGPPGVGKTSLGKSVAKALNRKYVRMSLGGVHDEAEIRGHRKTYIGAMPGRIIQNLKKANSSNPVFVLDEVDKIGRDVHGDPASALLEVLDPEQNNAFHDNFLEVDYDLSKTLFIATANALSTINPALLDRMELIEINGYLVEEKIEIARKHIIPKQLENHGIPKKSISLPKKTLEAIIEKYTRESGVRLLEKRIAQLMRRVARKLALDEALDKTISVGDLRNYLGVERFAKDKYEGNESIGVVTGLAWTASGGDILYIESSLSKGKGNLTLTGNLGDVMKESAQIAYEYVKSHVEEIGIEAAELDNKNVHIHVPEGAIPKDGPSAGITMVTSLVSSFTKRKVKNATAMTGEFTLRGKVLPVGGIKEKILAAKRANITDIILSVDNKKDLEEIKEIYIKGLNFHFVRNIAEVIDLALEK